MFTFKDYENLVYKNLDENHSEEIKQTIAEIKRTGKVTRKQYTQITGACLSGSYWFCKRNNINEDGIELEELRKILGNSWGAERFWKLIDEN